MNQLRILNIITGLSIGGAEMMLCKILDRIDRDRFLPHVISLTTKGELGSRIEELGITVDALGMKPARFEPTRFLKLVKRLRDVNPHIVHTWMYHSDFLGGLAARLAGIDAVGWAIRQSNLSRDHNKRSTLMVVKACAVLSRWIPRGILCCSDAAREIHVRFGYDGDKLITVPNGFDLEKFKPDSFSRRAIRSELGLASETPLVGMIARFDSQKNHIGFFKAAELIHQRRPDAHFLLAGAGVDTSNAALMSAARLAGIAGVCRLLGRRDDMPSLMAALDVVASPSHGEAFPNVLGEAMACEVPCVVTNVGDSAEIVGDTGRVVQPNDMQGLATAILELLELPASERAVLGRRARERTTTNYDINDIVKRYECFYLDLLNGRQSCAG